MKAKSHRLPSANWGPGRAGGVVLVQTQRPENQGSQWRNPRLSAKAQTQECWCPRAEERSQIKQSKVFRLPIQMPISSGKTLTDTPRNDVLPAIWASWSPVKLTHKINHHNNHHITSVESNEFLQSEHTHIPQSRNKTWPVPPESSLVPPSSFKGNYYFDFYHHRLLLQVFKLYINGFVLYILLSVVSFTYVLIHLFCLYSSS